MDAGKIGKFNGHMLYTGLRLDYRLRLFTPKSTLHAASAVAELLVTVGHNIVMHFAATFCHGDANSQTFPICRLFLNKS